MAIRKSRASAAAGKGPATPRRAAPKHRSPVKRTPAAVEEFVVRDRIASTAEADLDALDAMLAKRSPEDAQALARALLKRHRTLDEKARFNADDALADDWRNGGYPYRNLLSRKSYERR